MAEVMAACNKALSYPEFVEALQKGARLLDSREKVDEGVIDGALNVSFSG
jgi:hypothetical protein